MGRPKSNHAGSVQRSYYNASETETPTVVADNRTTFYGFLVENNSASDVYLHVYDTDNAGALGSIIRTFRITAEANFGKDSQEVGIDRLETGLTILVSGDRATVTAPAAGATVHLWYWDSH